MGESPDDGGRRGSRLDRFAAAAVIVACTTISIDIARGWFSEPVIPPTREIGRPVVPLPRDPVSIDSGHVKGSLNAKVAIIEFSDFQCPFCGVFARETLPPFIDEYVDSGLVLFAFRHFPLSRLHPLASTAATVAECAAEQGKFWPMHDQLFRSKFTETLDSLRGLEQTVLLDEEQFTRCQADPRIAERIIRESESARALGISGTPTFLIGFLQSDRTVRVVRRLGGAQKLQQLRKVIDEIVKESADPN